MLSSISVPNEISSLIRQNGSCGMIGALTFRQKMHHLQGFKIAESETKSKVS